MRTGLVGLLAMGLALGAFSCGDDDDGAANGSGADAAASARGRDAGAAGANAPSVVFYRPEEDDFSTQFRAGPPETPIYFHGGQYMTNCFNSSPTSGCALATVWLLKGGVAKPVASLGRANDWGLLATEPFRARWPAGVDLTGDRAKNAALFVWSDLNGDGRVQPGEVTMQKAVTGGVLLDEGAIEKRDGLRIAFVEQEPVLPAPPDEHDW